MEAPRKKAAERNRWSACSGMSNLPRHVLMEILCRLPIKTLLSCQSVCKLWLNLISTDSHFAKLHFQRSPSELLFHSNSYPWECTRFYMGNIQFENNSAPNLKFSPLFDFPRISVARSNFVDYRNTHICLWSVNSCNGLVCLRNTSGNQFTVICNPIRGDFTTIPAPGSGEHMPLVVSYGLGFSKKANRYKLLRLMQPKKSLKLFAEIFTIEKGSSWRNVGDLPYTIPGGKWSKPVFLEGKLHWLCLLSRSPYVAISCFDLDDELFDEVPLPPGAISCFERREKVPFPPSCNDWSRMTFGILGGCLFYSHFGYGSNNGVDIWVMKEYGVKDSWTKAFSIAKYPPTPSQSYFRMHIPIQHLATGEILMLHQYRHLALHNQAVNSMRTIGCIDKLEMNAFSPTLLLLKDVLMGYDAPVCDVKFRHAYLERQKLEEAHWWKSVEKDNVQKSPQQQGSEAPLTNDVAVAGEERNGHVSPTSEFSFPESSKTQLVCEQGTDALTSDEIHVPITGEERHGSVSGTGQVQTPASSSATHVTTEVLWRKMKAMVHNLGEELRKERQQRQELEQRLQNEVAMVEPLKEQTEHLKQQNQQLEQSLRDEQAKVEQLKEQIQQTEQFKQVNQQMMLEMMDEMRAQLGGSQ